MFALARLVQSGGGAKLLGRRFTYQGIYMLNSETVCPPPQINEKLRLMIQKEMQVYMNRIRDLNA